MCFGELLLMRALFDACYEERASYLRSILDISVIINLTFRECRNSDPLASNFFSFVVPFKIIFFVLFY